MKNIQLFRNLTGIPTGYPKSCMVFLQSPNPANQPEPSPVYPMDPWVPTDMWVPGCTNPAGFYRGCRL